MLKRYLITLGARTTADGKVISARHFRKINGVPVAVEDDQVQCPRCNSIGVIKPQGPRLNERINGKQVSLHDDLCVCKCHPPPRLVANQTVVCQIIDSEHYAAQAAATAAQVLAAPPPPGNKADDLLPVRLLHPGTREPFKYRPYKLELTDKVIAGTTDDEGCTQPLSATDRASVIAWHIDDASVT